MGSDLEEYFSTSVGLLETWLEGPAYSLDFKHQNHRYSYLH